MGLFGFMRKKEDNDTSHFICKSCGTEFDPLKAEAEFNSHFDGEHDYIYNGWEGFCADCAISNTELDDEEGIDYDENNPPPGCRECGGPYPNCTTSCPMFDD